MDPIRIAFIGAGGMGQCAHLRNYAQLPDCEVVALAELQADVREGVARRYGIRRTYETHDQLLASEKVDAIVAAQPFNRHATLLPDLLKAGVPIFTEKPLAASIDAGRTVLHALTASGTWQMLGYHKRSDPASTWAVDEIARLKATGELGALRYIRITMPAGDWAANGFSDLIQSSLPRPTLPVDPPPADLRGTSLEKYVEFVNYYIHQVNFMRYLFGEPYKVTYADPAGVLMAVLSASGVPGTIEMSPYTTTTSWEESALVAFEHGWLRIDLPAPMAINRPGTVTIMRDPGNGSPPETVTPTLPWVSAMKQQAINFIAAVRGERKPMCDAFEAMEDLKIAREYIRLWLGE